MKPGSNCRYFHFDPTTIMTGRLKSACHFLEQKLDCDFFVLSFQLSYVWNSFYMYLLD